MKYLFVGNRAGVFNQMLKLNCKFIKVFAIKDSFLEKELKVFKFPYEVIENKNKLIKDINELEFDCLVSNGCPYILPVSDMKKEHQIFLNIHPSLLPDLKGKHPINGAILFNRKHGVTCHHMDDGIDTGEIISNIEIPITQDMDLGLIYQLSFIAEGEVFNRAYNRNFLKEESQINDVAPKYYSRKEEDLLITSENTFDEVMIKIHAFGVPSLCAKFYKEKRAYNILKAKILKNNVLEILFKDINNDEVICCFDNSVVVKLNNKYIQFDIINSPDIKVGDKFFNFNLKEKMEV